MPFEVKLHIIGEQRVAAVIDGLVDRSKDLTAPLLEARKTMLRSIDLNFEQGGRPLHWRPLSPRYLKRKLLSGYSPLPLTKTGNLRRSMAGLVENNKLMLGTSVHYAPYHQRGTRTIPKRPFLLFQDRDLDHIGRALVRHVMGK